MNQPVRILYVDDYPLDRELVRDALEKEHGGFDVTEAASRPAFETALAQGNFDLILSDFNILGFEGLQVLEAVRAKDLDLPVIIVTGTGSEEVAAEAIKRGAADYVIKSPKHIQRLPHVIHFVLEKKQLEDERQQAREALRESEARYRRLHESMMDCFAEVNMSGKITAVNPSYLAMLGYSEEEVLKLRYTDITPPRWHQFEQEIVETRILPLGYSDVYEKEYIKKDGTVFPIELRTFLLRDAAGQPIGMWAIVRDITERKQVENQLKTSLKEKEMLLQELYHRTKNNMQVIISILSLQAAEIGDEKVLGIFKDTQNRIQSMALVHQKLYQSQNLSSINLKEYIQDLVSLLIESYPVSLAGVSLTLNLEDVFVLVDTAIPCGLVLNELISNVLKHAFPDGRRGKLTVELHKLEQEIIELYVADNGVGVAEGFDFRTAGRMGLQTIFGVVEYQLRGQVTFEIKGGVAYKIRFKDASYSQRV